MSSYHVVADETIAPYSDANNGAGPLWAFGSRIIARCGSTVYASVGEVDPAAKPLCNTRWVLYRRKDGAAWQRLAAAHAANEREPCPLARLPGDGLLLSTNPAQAVRDTMKDGRLACHCAPRLLRFDTAAPEHPPAPLSPRWDRPYAFTEHSYRALAADPATGHVLLTNQVWAAGDHRHTWSLLDPAGQPLCAGLLRFPMRGCYQQIAVRFPAVHVLAISDEVEPVAAWRDHKRHVSGNEWDYEFRQLFYTYTPDALTQDFSPPLTVASADETAGLISNLDLWLDHDGDAHVLYLERNVWHAHVRDAFFPELPISVALKYARLHAGRVVERRVLQRTTEDRRRAAGAAAPAPSVTPTPLVMDGPVPEWGCFHAAPGQRLYVLWYQRAPTPADRGNFIRQLLPEAGPAVRLPIDPPLTRFAAACERNGCAPAAVIDLCGTPAQEKLVRYAQVRIE